MPPSQEHTAQNSHAVRNGLICSVIFLACWLIARPFANLAFVDDWAFTRTAQVLAQTGHFHYFGWGAPMLGWQAVWGALFIKLFGFSFNVVRLSMLPIAAATVFIFHAILVRFGIHARNAILGALAFGLSPLFMPLTASFMTDIPGVFCILLCLYLCLRAVAAHSDRAAIAWLAAAALSNILGGTVRQIVWLGILVIVPSAAWLLRKRRGVLPSVAMFWLVGGACIYACTSWFALQPYAVLHPELPHAGNPVARTIVYLLNVAFCSLLLLFPILAAWLSQVHQLSKAALLRAAMVLAVYALLIWKTKWVMPWLPDVLAGEFGSPQPAKFGSLPQLILPMAARMVISILVVAAALIFAESACARKMQSQTPSTAPSSWLCVLSLLGPFSAVYLAILAVYDFPSDRYLLMLMPLAIIILLKLYQQQVAESLPAFSVALLALFALLAIAGTHDWLASYRARVRAIHEVRASGIPRTAIQGGFEYDGWTQLEIGGHATRNVPKSLRDSDPGFTALRLTRRCTSDFEYAPITPTVRANFFITRGEIRCLAPSKIPPVTYHAWLPPFHRNIYIQQLP